MRCDSNVLIAPVLRANEMSDRRENLRRQAARCLAAAQTSRDPKTRDELIRIAARFHELANNAAVDDLSAILGSFNDAQMVPPSKPVVQHQRQVQPGQKPEES